MRVLFATDGSADALHAAEFLRAFPLPEGTAISVLSVAAIPASFDPGDRGDLEASFRRSARDAAERAREVLAGRPAVAEVVVADSGPGGDPRDAIIDAADRADLVVVGARGLGAVSGFLLGSVSTAVARHARSSVLVVKGNVRRVRSVVIGVDGSDNSNDALAFVAGLGDLRDVSVQLVGVAEEARVPSTAPAMIAPRLQAIVEDLHRARCRELDVMLTRGSAPLAGRVAALGHSTAVGNAAERIVAEASARQADLVVVGARGLGTMKRLLLGSVSEAVLRHAGGPVLIVKGSGPRPG